MQQSRFIIQGMTCGGCVASVKKQLQVDPAVQEVTIDLPTGSTIISASKSFTTDAASALLSDKYTVHNYAIEIQETVDNQSKIRQLRPLFIILAAISVAAIVMNYKSLDVKEIMLDYMGLFLVVFSFFKFLDLPGFVQSFAMYDPLASRVKAYGWLYPFLEVALGVLILLRFELSIVIPVAMVILAITTVGVVVTLSRKRKIQCACLGTVLKLPMTEATFIENAIMLLMGVFFLF